MSRDGYFENCFWHLFKALKSSLSELGVEMPYRTRKQYIKSSTECAEVKEEVHLGGVF